MEEHHESAARKIGAAAREATEQPREERKPQEPPAEVKVAEPDPGEGKQEAPKEAEPSKVEPDPKLLARIKELEELNGKLEAEVK